MLTKKHFIAIAKILFAVKATDEVIETFAGWLATENPRFNAVAFFIYAGHSKHPVQGMSVNVNGVPEPITPAQ